MALTQKRLAGPSAIENTASATTLPASGNYTYEVPASTTTIVKQIMLTNTAGEPASMTMWIKPSATAYASLTNGNIIYYDFAVESNSTTLLNLSLVLAQSDRIYVRASGTDKMNITMSGLEES
jgi:hypothetical protein